MYNSKHLIAVFNFIKMLILCALFLYIPVVENLDFYNSTIIAKFFSFNYLLLVLLVIQLFIFLINQKSFCLKIKKLEISLFLILAFIIINRFFIQTDYGFSIRFFEIIGLSILYLILRTCKISFLILLIAIVILSGIIQAFYGLLQIKGVAHVYNFNFIITGNFLNPGIYCGFLGIIFVISFGVVLFQKKIKDHLSKEYSSYSKLLITLIKIIAIIALTIITIVYTYINSKASILAIICGCSIIIFRSKIFYLKKNKKTTIALVISFILLSVCYFSLTNKKSDSTRGRIFIWKINTRIIKDNIFTGIGYENSKAYYMDYQAQYFQENVSTKDEKRLSDDIYYTFNDFIQYVVENGAIGLSLLVLSILIYIRTSVEHHVFKIFMTGIITSIIVLALFSYPSHILPIKMIFTFCLAFISIDSKDVFYEKSITVLTNTQRLYIKLLVSITFIACLHTMLYLGKLQYSYKIWNIAMIDYDNKNFTESSRKFEAVSHHFRKNGDFLMNYGKTCTLNNQNEKAIGILITAKKYLKNSIIEIALGNAYQSVGNYRKSEESYKKAIYMTPNRFYPLYLLAKLYQKTGQKIKAKEVAREILSKDVKVNSTAIEEIKEEMSQVLEQ